MTEGALTTQTKHRDLSVGIYGCDMIQRWLRVTSVSDSFTTVNTYSVTAPKVYSTVRDGAGSIHLHSIRRHANVCIQVRL